MKKILFASIMAIALIGMSTSCDSPSLGGDSDDEVLPTVPTVNSVLPKKVSINVPINRYITATFSESMNGTTIDNDSFIVAGLTKEAGTIALNSAGTTATFTPSTNLSTNTLYTVTITTKAKTLKGVSLASDYVWTFTTGEAEAAGPDSVNLGTAGNFVILAKTKVSVTGTTAVTGDIGISPSAQTYLTGFSEIRDATNVFATSALVTGKLYAANMEVPTPANLTTAISDMQTAYTNAAGRKDPDFVNHGAGDVSGLTLVPGLYAWDTGLLLASDVTLNGGANDVWIFQIAGDLTVNNAVKLTLSGGAVPENIFWQVAGETSLGTTSDFKGIILCQTQIVIKTGAVFNGRALAQTAVTLDANGITKPAL